MTPQHSLWPRCTACLKYSQSHHTGKILWVSLLHCSWSLGTVLDIGLTSWIQCYHTFPIPPTMPSNYAVTTMINHHHFTVEALCMLRNFVDQSCSVSAYFVPLYYDPENPAMILLRPFVWTDHSGVTVNYCILVFSSWCPGIMDSLTRRGVCWAFNTPVWWYWCDHQMRVWKTIEMVVFRAVCCNHADIFIDPICRFQAFQLKMYKEQVSIQKRVTLNHHQGLHPFKWDHLNFDKLLY